MHSPHIRVTRLPDEFMGCYDASTDTIWLDDRLTGPEHRCTLTHELVHAERQDQPLGNPDLSAKREVVVHREAARRLISVDQLAEAVAWAAEARELAECLDVDLPTLQARLDSLNASEREYLDRVARSRQCEEA